MKIVFAEPFSAREAVDLARRLTGHTLVTVDDPDRLATELIDADAVVCHRLTAADTAQAEKLRLVQAVSAGADGIDRAAIPNGALLCNAAGAGRTIAEWC